MSGSSKGSLNIWKFSIHILLKPGLENFEHYFASVWDECNCAVVWAFFGFAIEIIMSAYWAKQYAENKYFTFYIIFLFIPNQQS